MRVAKNVTSNPNGPKENSNNLVKSVKITQFQILQLTGPKENSNNLVKSVKNHAILQNPLAQSVLVIFDRKSPKNIRKSKTKSQYQNSKNVTSIANRVGKAKFEALVRQRWDFWKINIDSPEVTAGRKVILSPRPSWRLDESQN